LTRGSPSFIEFHKLRARIDIIDSCKKA